MNNKLKKVLNKLTSNGYEAYIVGGYVRDYLLGIESTDIDICTSALPKETKEIFELQSINDEYGRIHFKDKFYKYDITTFRKEKNYINRKPSEIEYVETIEEDVVRRDFTINSIYMDEFGNIHDIVNGLEDLHNKIIRTNGDIALKMTEDNLRILRALRFATVYNFTIESELFNFIKQNKQLLSNLSFNRKKEELDKIFSSKNIDYGIKLIKDLEIESVLDIKINNEIKYTSDKLGVWAQIEFNEDYPFTKNQFDEIQKIRKIINYGTVDNIILYEYGIYPSIIAGEILGISKNYISEIYKNLPIYSSKDIKIDGDEIMRLLKIEQGPQVKKIIQDVEINIITNNLPNKIENIREYIVKNWR